MDALNSTQPQPHCIILPFPLVGHINPMLQFAKRLGHRGVHVTFFITKYIAKTTPFSSPSFSIETFSNGFDAGYPPVQDADDIAIQFREIELPNIKKALQRVLTDSSRPVDCIVYDSVINQGVEIAEEFNVAAAAFCTQSCAVDWIYHEVFFGKLRVPISSEENEVLVPGLPALKPRDLPTFVSRYGVYPLTTRVLVEQFRGIEKAKWLFINTFYELEEEVIHCMAKSLPVKPIGPAIPSMYLDQRLPDDTDYGLSIFTPATSTCLDWLNQCPPKSVVYVSFGSMAQLGHEQMAELAWGLKLSNFHFLWVVRSSEQSKLPDGFTQQMSRKGLVVAWGPQLDILAHTSTSCFITHCGWNSTLEALSLGVPVVAMPQWTDQPTNAKWMEDVWKTGVRVLGEAENGDSVSRETIANGVREVMEGERSEEVRKNAGMWKEMAREAMEEGGSSDKNIDEFVRALVKGH